MGKNLLNNIGVYKITNVKNGKFYIGSTSSSFYKRWSEHKSLLKNNKHINLYLQRSFNKHGQNSFLYEIIETCNKKQDVLQAEQKWLDSLRSQNPDKCYNLCSFVGSKRGLKHSEETKRKISESNMGKTYTAEQRRRMSEGQKGVDKYWMRGRKLSEDTKKKLSESHMYISRGEKNSKAKLKEDDIIRVKQLLSEGITQREIASLFFVSRETISGIKNGRLWGWLQV